MKPQIKWGLLLGALGVSAWLALFGDKTPPGEAEGVGAEVRDEAVVASPNESPTPPLQARNTHVLSTWSQTLGDPFGAPAAAPTPASPPRDVTATHEPSTLFTVIGRSTVQGRELVHALDAQGEVLTLHVGAQAGPWRVQALNHETLLLRHRQSGQEIKLPIGSRDGVFDRVDVRTPHETAP